MSERCRYTTVDSQNILHGFLFVCLFDGGFLVFNATFNNISVLLVEETRENQVIDKLYHIMLHTSPWMRIELAISMVIGTDCIGSCKSNYHTIAAVTAPILHGDVFFNIKRKIYKKDFAELTFVNVVFYRMVMIYMEFVIFSLFAMHLDYCNIQRVYDQR
jgi:hypothetical protein